MESEIVRLYKLSPHLSVHSVTSMHSKYIAVNGENYFVDVNFIDDGSIKLVHVSDDRGRVLELVKDNNPFLRERDTSIFAPGTLVEVIGHTNQLLVNKSRVSYVKSVSTKDYIDAMTKLVKYSRSYDEMRKAAFALVTADLPKIRLPNDRDLIRIAERGMHVGMQFARDVDSKLGITPDLEAILDAIPAVNE
jgi:hypothetical protein